MEGISTRECLLVFELASYCLYNNGVFGLSELDILLAISCVSTCLRSIVLRLLVIESVYLLRLKKILHKFRRTLPMFRLGAGGPIDLSVANNGIRMFNMRQVLLGSINGVRLLPCINDYGVGDDVEFINSIMVLMMNRAMDNMAYSLKLAGAGRAFNNSGGLGSRNNGGLNARMATTSSTVFLVAEEWLVKENIVVQSFSLVDIPDESSVDGIYCTYNNRRSSVKSRLSVLYLIGDMGEDERILEDRWFLQHLGVLNFPFEGECPHTIIVRKWTSCGEKCDPLGKAYYPSLSDANGDSIYDWNSVNEVLRKVRTQVGIGSSGMVDKDLELASRNWAAKCPLLTKGLLIDDDQVLGYLVISCSSDWDFCRNTGVMIQHFFSPISGKRGMLKQIGRDVELLHIDVRVDGIVAIVDVDSLFKSGPRGSHPLWELCQV